MEVEEDVPGALSLQLEDQEHTVGAINDGVRKKPRQKRRTELERRSRYDDTDPLLLQHRPPCKHNSAKLQCGRANIEDVILNRQTFFKQKGKVQQEIYLTRFIAPYATERRRPKSTPPAKRRNRPFSTTYFMRSKGKNIPVCQAFFMKTFSVKKDRLRRIAKTIFEGKIPKEHRGGDRKSVKSAEKKEKLKSFIEKLPAQESHYNRQKSKRVYLTCDLNINKLRKLYNDSVAPEFQFKKTMFHTAFVTHFNIGFRSPASDACSTCILLGNKIKMEKDVETKNRLVIEKRVHKLRAKYFYKLCKQTDADSLSFCFDLQQVQPLPRTPIQESFYARQISYYNLCFVGMNSANPVFYQWTEDQSGRGSVEVGSAMLHYLNEIKLDGITTLRLFCDGCGGQNKNSHIIHCLMYWLVNKSPGHLQEIQLTFPVRGHSFLAADRVFGRVEKYLRTKNIVVQKEDYEEIYKKFGRVCLLGQDWKVMNIKSLENYYKKLDGMRDLKRVHLKKHINVTRKRGQRVQSGTKYLIRTYRNFLNESEEERVPFCILKRQKVHPRDQLQQINSARNLTQAKKNDVKMLMTKQFGEQWINEPEFEWYKKVLEEDQVGGGMEDHDGRRGVHDCNDEEECDCNEIEIMGVV